MAATELQTRIVELINSLEEAGSRLNFRVVTRMMTADSVQAAIVIAKNANVTVPPGVYEQFGVDQQLTERLAHVVYHLVQAQLPKAPDDALEVVNPFMWIDYWTTPAVTKYDDLMSAESLEAAAEAARGMDVADETLTRLFAGQRPTTAEEPGRGRAAANVRINAYDDNGALVLTMQGVVFGIGEGGDLVVAIPDFDADSFSATGQPVTQGMKLKVEFGEYRVQPNGEPIFNYDEIFMTKAAGAATSTRNNYLASARVFFASPNLASEIQDALIETGHDLPPELSALEEAEEGEPSIYDELDIQAMLDSVETAEEEAGLLRLGVRQEPVRVLYDEEGNRVRILGPGEEPPERKMIPGTELPPTFSTRVGTLSGSLTGLSVERDPVSGVYIGGRSTVKPVDPYYTQEMVTDFLDSLSAEEFGQFKAEAIRNGLMPAAAAEMPKGAFDVTNAVQLAMIYANENGVLDFETISDPVDAVFIAMNSWGANNLKPLPDYKPPSPRVLPSEEELAFTVADYFEQRTGRRPTSWEMKDLVDYLTKQYRLAMDQQDIYAERQYLLDAEQGQLDAGQNPWHLSSAQKAKLTMPLPREIFQMNPQAAFQMYFEENYKPAVQAAEAQQTAVDFRQSLLGSMRTLTGSRNAL